MSAQRGTASSRLLSMRFMQRAAAASPSSAPSTPDGPPSKRRRVSNDASSPFTPTSDLERMKAAEADEERKRDAVMERLAAEGGETRWVLSVKEPGEHRQEKGFHIVQAGFADLDSEEDDMSTSKVVTGRMRFGKFTEKPQEAKQGSANDFEESEDDDDEVEDEDPADALIRQQQKRVAAEEAKAARMIKRATEGEKSRQMAAARKRKGVKLNQPRTSLSGR